MDVSERVRQFGEMIRVYTRLDIQSMSRGYFAIINNTPYIFEIFLANRNIIYLSEYQLGFFSDGNRQRLLERIDARRRDTQMNLVNYVCQNWRQGDMELGFQPYVNGGISSNSGACASTDPWQPEHVPASQPEHVPASQPGNGGACSSTDPWQPRDVPLGLEDLSDLDSDSDGAGH